MSTKKSKGILRTILTILSTAIITCIITTVVIYSTASKSTTSSSSTSAVGSVANSSILTAKLSLIKNTILSEYIGEVDEDEMIEGAIKGYVSGLNDIYTEYFTADEMSEYMEDTVGEYVGIGVYITKDYDNNQIVIYGTISNSPAEEVGLQTGDILVSVNGEECDGDDYDTITSKIKGVEGTTVTIEVIRDGESLTFEIDRKTIEVNHVAYMVLEDNVGYIYISSFEGNVAKQFTAAFEELQAQGITSLIIDIRNNGGGIVTEALTIADLMTDKDVTLLIEEDKAGKETVTKSDANKTIDMPIVLLVNEYSASASEILAGILQEDVENATVVGNTTYGKGVIQTLYTLTDGSGLKITTSEYFTPNHNSINGVGITPDVVVDDYLFLGYLDEENDTQLQKALELLK